MNNQQRESLTHMVGQNAPVFPHLDTVKLSLTPKGAKATVHFLEMAQVAQARQVDEPPPAAHRRRCVPEAGMLRARQDHGPVGGPPRR